jgi:valyl-tRNA synthetase
MRGKDVLWQPGWTMPASPRRWWSSGSWPEAAEPSRREMGRENSSKIWEWKDESGGMIFNQLKRLGASCDWSRERFTMDEGLSEAVLEVFVSSTRKA